MKINFFKIHPEQSGRYTGSPSLCLLLTESIRLYSEPFSSKLALSARRKVLSSLVTHFFTTFFENFPIRIFFRFKMKTANGLHGFWKWSSVTSKELWMLLYLGLRVYFHPSLCCDIRKTYFTNDCEMVSKLILRVSCFQPSFLKSFSCGNRRSSLCDVFKVTFVGDDLYASFTCPTLHPSWLKVEFAEFSSSSTHDGSLSQWTHRFSFVLFHALEKQKNSLGKFCFLSHCVEVS